MQNKSPKTHVILDNDCLETRCNDGLNGTDKNKIYFVYEEISKIVIYEYGTPMRVCQAIYQDLSTILSANKSYFQIFMMLLRNSKETFDELLRHPSR